MRVMPFVIGPDVPGWLVIAVAVPVLITMVVCVCLAIWRWLHPERGED